MSNDFRQGALLAGAACATRRGLALTPVFEDSKWEPKEAVAAFRKLSDVEHVRFFYVLGSGMTLAVKPLSEAEGLLLFSSAAHPDILPASRDVIRHGNDTAADARRLADAIAQNSPHSVASIHVQNAWGDAYDAALEQRLRERIPDLHYARRTHLPEDTAFGTTAARIVADKPNVAIVGSFGLQAAYLVRELVRHGFTGQIYANNGLALSEEPQALLRAGGITGFLYQRYPAIAPAFAEAFRAAYHQEPGVFAMHAYTDFELLCDAIATQGPDPALVARKIRGMGSFHGRFEDVAISPEGDIVVETIIDTFK